MVADRFATSAGSLSRRASQSRCRPPPSPGRLIRSGHVVNRIGQGRQLEPGPAGCRCDLRCCASPYESVQVQGTASIEDDPDGVLVDELSHKYTGGPYPRGEGGIGYSGPNPQWVIVRLTADKVVTTWPSS